MTRRKNVKLTNRISERQAVDIDVIGLSLYGDSIYLKLPTNFRGYLISRVEESYISRVLIFANDCLRKDLRV